MMATKKILIALMFLTTGAVMADDFAEMPLDKFEKKYSIDFKQSLRHKSYQILNRVHVEYGNPDKGENGSPDSMQITQKKFIIDSRESRSDFLSAKKQTYKLNWNGTVKYENGERGIHVGIVFTVDKDKVDRSYTKFSGAVINEIEISSNGVILAKIENRNDNSEFPDELLTFASSGDKVTIKYDRTMFPEEKDELPVRYTIWSILSQPDLLFVMKAGDGKTVYMKSDMIYSERDVSENLKVEMCTVRILSEIMRIVFY